MILFIEGPRHSGKTYLINNFLSVCNDPRIEYYKFYFANHIKMLDLVKLDDSAALHYFSLGNIMTIMEMNLRPEYRDKIWIFDRAILSANAWAILRGRLSIESAKSEYSKLVSSDVKGTIKKQTYLLPNIHPNCPILNVLLSQTAAHVLVPSLLHLSRTDLRLHGVER